MKPNWPIKKLGECLVQFDRGISWSRSDEGGSVAVLRIPNIEEGHINLDDLKYINVKNEKGELEKNDIVMVTSNGNPNLVGRSALVTKTETGMRFASFLVRLRFSSSKLLSCYVHLFFLTPVFKRELRRKIATTSGIYNLRKEHVEHIKIPLPPLEIQKQIVERMDKIAEAQKLNDELIQKADELFQSLLHQELNPEGKNWGIRKLAENAFITSGGTPSRKRPEFFGGAIPWVKSGELKDGFVWDTKEKITEEALNKSSAKIFPTDTVLVAMYGATVGKVGMLKIQATTNQAIAGIQPKKDILDPYFVFYFLLLTAPLLIGKSVGGAQPNINQGIIKNLKIPTPPIKEQKQIVEKLSAAQEYKKQLLEQKLKLKELFDSVLHKSMNSQRAPK